VADALAQRTAAILGAALALAAYAADDASGSHSGYGFMIFAIEGEKITGIAGFPSRPELFDRLGLPAEIPA
jgi:hypothetical protein